MELRQLEHFVAVAEELHFGRAAGRAHIVQSGLSASIRSLERALGSELFARSTRRVELTEAGRALLPEARLALAAAHRARQAVAEVEGLLRGSVSIGIMQLLDAVDLPVLLGRFRRDHPDVEIRLRQAAAVALVEQVRSGQLDLAFAAVPHGEPHGVEARPLTDEPMLLACARTHPHATRRKLYVGDLEDETFIELPPDWGIRIAVDRAFAAAGITRHVAFELNDMRTLLELVAHGLGIAIVPRSVSAYELPIELVALRGDAPRWQISLLTRTRGRQTPAASALIDMLSGAVRTGQAGRRRRPPAR